MSFAALVLGVAGVLTAGITVIPAIVCGHVALSRIKAGQASGRGIAIAALILSYLLGAVMFYVLLQTRVGGTSRPEENRPPVVESQPPACSPAPGRSCCPVR